MSDTLFGWFLEDDEIEVATKRDTSELIEIAGYFLKDTDLYSQPIYAVDQIALRLGWFSDVWTFARNCNLDLQERERPIRSAGRTLGMDTDYNADDYNMKTGRNNSDSRRASNPQNIDDAPEGYTKL